MQSEESALTNQNLHSELLCLGRDFWAKLFEQYQTIYGDIEQASLAVAKRALDRETGMATGNTINVTPEERITRAIQAFEYVEPFYNTEEGKPLFSLVHRMLAGSNNSTLLYERWSPEAIKQFDEYYKDSKHQGYKFRFVEDPTGCLKIIDVRNNSVPQVLCEYDNDTPAYSVTVQNGIAYVGNDYGLQIINVSNASNPIFLGSYNLNRQAFNVRIQNGIAYYTDGLFEPRYINVSNPGQPKLLDFCPMGLNSQNELQYGNNPPVFTDATSNPRYYANPADLFDSAPMSISPDNFPMLNTYSQQNVSYGVAGLGALALGLGLGAAYLAKKCGFFRQAAAPAVVMAPQAQAMEQPMDNQLIRSRGLAPYKQS